jgi:hypothetical protein
MPLTYSIRAAANEYSSTRRNRILLFKITQSRMLARLLHKIVWRQGRQGQRGFRTSGFQLSRKSGPTIRAQFDAMQNAPKLSYEHLHFQKFSGGYTPDPPGGGRGGVGREGREEGRELSRFGPTELWSP